MSTIKNSSVENLRSDIAIIGGGGAGLTAAVAAAEAGVKNIIVLEKAPTPGGNAAMSHGIFAINSPAQKRLGIEIPVDEVFKRQMENSNWMVDPRLIHAFINKSGEVIQWLEDKGMRFDSVIEFLPGGRYPRVFHVLVESQAEPLGQRLIGTLVKSCQDSGVRLLCETAAGKILTDDQGRVNGVIAKAKDKELKITTKSVIITAGGFGGNKEMLDKYLAGSGDIATLSIPQVTGDGLKMAAEVGAVTDDHFTILLIGPTCEGPHSLMMLLMRPELMLLNKNGERYSNEALFLDYHTWSGNILSRQPGKMCYALLDEEIKRDIIQKRDSLSGFFKEIGNNGAWMDELDNDLQKEADRGKIKMSDSWDEIAGWINVTNEVLKAAIERYNAFCDKGYDADFLKDKRYLMHLRTPPFYAIPGKQSFDTTLGGIRINHRMEVINKQVCPISGLYAAGDNAGSWLSQNYDLTYPGSALGFALSSGFIAGENAAKYVLEKK